MDRPKTTFRNTARRGLTTRACGVSIPMTGGRWQAPGSRCQAAGASRVLRSGVTSCSAVRCNYRTAHHAGPFGRPAAGHGKSSNPLSANASRYWNMPVGPVPPVPGRSGVTVKVLRNTRNSIRDSIRCPDRIQSRIDLRIAVVGCPMKDTGSSPASGVLIGIAGGNDGSAFRTHSET